MSDIILALITVVAVGVFVSMPAMFVLAWWRKRRRHRRGLAAEVERHG